MHLISQAEEQQNYRGLGKYNFGQKLFAKCLKIISLLFLAQVNNSGSDDIHTLFLDHLLKHCELLANALFLQNFTDCKWCKMVKSFSNAKNYNQTNFVQKQNPILQY